MGDLRGSRAEFCELCGGAGETEYDRLGDRLFGVAGEWSIRRCPAADCGLMWLDPKPLEADLHLAYVNYYTHVDGRGLAAGDRASAARALARGLESLLLLAVGLRRERRSLEIMRLDSIEPGRVLEVGCGDGARLAGIRAAGWEVMGQDVDAVSVERARSVYGLEVHHGPISDPEFDGEVFDAVVMNHVVEHVFDPVALLRRCRTLLSPTGILVLTTPNPDSYGRHKFSQSWVALEPPRHLHLFSPPAAQRLVQMAGFSFTRITTSASRSGGTLMASRDIARTGHHVARGSLQVGQILAAGRYAMAARYAHLRNAHSGEEVVVVARP